MRSPIPKTFLFAFALTTLLPAIGFAQFLGTSSWRSTGKVFFAHLEETSWNGTAGEVIDSSGRGNHARAAAATAPFLLPTPGNPGHLQNAGSFSGTSTGYLVAPNSASFSFTNGLSVSVWFKTTGTSLQRIVSKGLWGASTPGWYIGINHGGAGKIRFGLGTNVPVVDSVGSFNDGSWHHVVITFTSSSVNAIGKMFIDGAQSNMSFSSVGCTLAPTSPANYFQITAVGGGCSLNTASTDPLGVGAYIGASAVTGEPFTGLIDEVTIWNRALTDSEAMAVP